MTEYPFGREWTCILCWATYPEDFEPMECPNDNGHLHRVRFTVGPMPDDQGVLQLIKMEALLAVHDEEGN